jgi:DNA-binding PadR family transcriptional regulator
MHGRLDAYMRCTYTAGVKTSSPLLPALRPVELEVLLALADEEKHGYAIMQEAAERTGGALRLDPGTLYRALERMRKAGLVAESARRPDPAADDERRRYYRITPLGRRAARAEMERMEALVRAARRSRLLGES